MLAKKNKTKYNFWGDENPEKLNESPKLPSSVRQLTDLINPVNLIDQIFSNPKSENIALDSEKEKHRKISRTETIFSYSRTHSERELKEETAQILSELKIQVAALEKSEKALTREISKVEVETLPPKSGIYYLRYFEWLMSIVRGLRLKIEEGRSWLAAFNQRKSKRKGYWKMYKKHGTTFGLSHERGLATQTG